MRKCRRKDLTTDDFAFALKLHYFEVNFDFDFQSLFFLFSSLYMVVIQDQIIIIYSFVKSKKIIEFYIISMIILFHWMI